MSFFSTLEADFKKLFGKSANWIHLALAFTTYAAPFLEGFLSITDPAAEALVAPIITRLQTGLATVYALANEGASSGATVASVLASFASDLSTLEQVSGVKDPATQAKIATITSEVQAIVALLPSPTSIVSVVSGLKQQVATTQQPGGTAQSTPITLTPTTAA